ncbi:50S ribosomal protein L15 [Longimonas halophila]|uniref:Large ribosomal subunit protein uL15 n=1 Tax=Longimonas halophila TaxID=1469170 RepID=A0A2H3NIC3_9BACT|nr:50S ribosomal protein L15 [Longimonas halophila]PEN04779.1 50S ribosomal protein L15 [Longimonas halophila]
MDLSNLSPAKGATQKKKRLGRGVGSGRGGHSSTRGTKGQSSRSGSKNRPLWFEGGQMPLHRRVPKFGFTNPFPTEYSIVNISRIARLVAEGVLDADAPITPQVLEDAGAVRSAERVKVLGDGAISDAVEVEAHAFSSSAARKIEDAGGTTTTLE